MKNKQHTDVLVIGAGPAGALASSLLTRFGWQVTVLEKQHFPRFSIGESLLPQCMEFLAQAGMDDVVHKAAPTAAFQFKDGAAFHCDGMYTQFNFTEKFTQGPGTTYQVKRALFDDFLAKSAASQGVDIRFGHQVNHVELGEQSVTAAVESEADSYQIEAKYILDASGFARVLPRLLGTDTPSKLANRAAYFCHVKDNLANHEHFDRNKILISVHPGQRDIWYWLIPFSDGTASLGVVGDVAHFESYTNNHEALFDLVGQEANLAKILADATPINDVNRLQGYSADASSLCGQRYALLGNAGEFLDPVFSSGVTIAMKSASLIAPLVDCYLKGEQVDFTEQYERPLRQGVNCFKTFVNAWYDQRFQDVIFHQQQSQDIKQMISAILAGYAWDESNPYVAQSERRLNVLAELCRADS